ncbi:VOC family protein [Chryseobacterium sp.]|uniref:VOC family protein n=1 Tax=Chryseobacterium sp. TaxID=1871047 RepID=UPI002FC88E30
MNNDIFPCLWHNEDAKQTAERYCRIFNGKITADTPVVLNIELFGQKIMLLNGGPQFKKNASVSFMVMCETQDEVQNYWNQLADGGIVLMELGEYPWSKKYGWVRDQFGVTWQLCLAEKQGTQRIIPTLMFIHHNNGKALEAMQLYTRTFPNSKIGDVLKYEDGVGNENHEVPENIQNAHFEIDNYSFFCMDNSYDHQFDFNEGISMVVMTHNQEETDHLWNSLTENGGVERSCGWLKDKFGMSWQIIPKKLIELMSDPNQMKAQKVVQKMMEMQKIVIKDLEEAYNS